MNPLILSIASINLKTNKKNNNMQIIICKNRRYGTAVKKAATIWGSLLNGFRKYKSRDFRQNIQC